MPWPFRMWAIMAFHSFQSFVALSNSCSITIFLCRCSTIHSLKLVKQVTCCFHFDSFPFNMSFVSKRSFLVMQPRKFNSFLQFLSSLKLPHCSHVLSIVFSTFISETLIKVFSTSVRRMFNILKYIKDQTLHSRSACFYGHTICMS